MAARVSFASPVVHTSNNASVWPSRTNPTATFVQNELQKKPSFPAQSPSLVGRTALSSVENRVSHEVIEEVCKGIEFLFSGKMGALYRDLLKGTKNLNAQHDGWSLLHYSMHQINHVPEERKRYLLDFISYLVNQGARLDLEDARGRAPISFASSVGPKTDEEFWDFLLKNDASLNPQGCYIPPLHVACSLPGKSIRDFLDRGANPYTLDEFNRTPLHCFAIHGALKTEVSLQNLELLLSVCPNATAVADEMRNYPLYYALIFSPKDLWEPILRVTPADVVREIRAKVDAKGVPYTQELMRLWKTCYRTASPIYALPTSFQEESAASSYLPPERIDLLKSLDEAIKKKEIRVLSSARNVYYAHHDGHGWDYCLFTKKSKELFEEDPDSFIEKESEECALFYPSFIRTPLEYEKLVSDCVHFWVNSGADPKASYVEFQNPIGAVQGKKTRRVKIEGALDPRGAHIVPVLLTS